MSKRHKSNRLNKAGGEDDQMIDVCRRMLKVFKQSVSPDEVSPPNVLRVGLVMLDQLIEATSEMTGLPIEVLRQIALASSVECWGIDVMQFAISLPRIREVAFSFKQKGKA